MKIAYSNKYAHQLPDNHKFPMKKYDLIYEKIINDKIVSSQDVFEPREINDERILRVHSHNYLAKLYNEELTYHEIRRIGFPMDKSIISREKIIMQGTLESVGHAINDGISFNIAGGTHHAFTDKGEGFCIFNDMAIAAKYALDENLARRVLIIDLDVHQGNGTAEIFADEDLVFTFSMHAAENYPLQKEKSDLDIALKHGTNDFEYLNLLSKHLERVLDEFKPNLAFFQAGVDILSTDKYGRLNISIDGCRKRDEKVFAECVKRGIPVAVNMGGGYSRDVNVIVEAHVNTFETAKEALRTI